MKKLLFCLFIGLISFALTGCGERSQEDINELGDIINNNDKNNNNDNNTDIKLYSDNTKLVFDFNSVYKIVYYHSGNKITGLEYYYDYQDATTASYAYSAIKANYTSEDSIESVKQNGKYIIVKFKEEEFADTTLEEVKETYSYLKQVYENN